MEEELGVTKQILNKIIHGRRNISLEEQIFTSADELYNLKYNKEQLDKYYSHLVKGTGLGNSIEKKANLFEVLLLVPTNSLKKQIELLKVHKRIKNFN